MRGDKGRFYGGAILFSYEGVKGGEQLLCGGGGTALRFASRLHPGNGVAGTRAFPNGVWEREGDSENRVFSLWTEGRRCAKKKDNAPGVLKVYGI